MAEKLSLNSFNCRGLGNSIKRRSIFQWLKTYHHGITLLQETHSTESSENSWRREWGGDIVFSHGSSSARGVAILFPKGLDYSLNTSVIDLNGRFILLDIKTDDWELLLCNVYFPTKDKQTEQLDFINYITNQLIEFSDKNIILGGDFNLCLDSSLDKFGGDQIKNTNVQHIETLCEDYNLNDIWRTLNPDTKRFTWRAHTRGGFIQSRLDYWLVSIHMLYDLHKTDIKPSIKSDHSIITLSFNIQNTQQRGKGFWKFNNSLLKDKLYLDKINKCINDCKLKYANLDNKALKWDTIKCEIRSVTISYSSFKAKEIRAQENILKIRLEKLQKHIDLGNLNQLTDYNTTKKALDDIYSEKSKGIMIRSRAELIDCDEKCSKYFLNLEKRNYKVKYIKHLIDDIGNDVTEPTDILKTEERYYKKLYSKVDTTHKNTPDNFFTHNLKQLDQVDKDKCDLELSVEELGKNLKMLPNNKSPGCDGLTSEFYKIFWLYIKDLIFDSFLYSFESGLMSIDQRRAILCLLPKAKKDLRFLKNWRPLSILNTDYKLLAKLLATRLQSVIANIVGPDQSGYIKGRFIGENIRTIIDTIDYTNQFDTPGYILFLDFEKAFDSVSWEYLFKVLDAYNFGNTFKKWVKLLYTDPLLAVTNNGYASQFFPIQRGIRQGCPLSALLFLLVVETMADKLRSSPNIHGIDIKGSEVVISQLADDTSLFLKDKESVEQSLNLLSHFQEHAGLKLNKEKSEAISLGNMPTESKSISGIRLIKEPVKVLGIWISKNVEETYAINFEEKIDKLKKLLNMWRQRKLTLHGKVTVINSLALSQIMYVSSVLYVPPWVLEEVNTIIFSFLWPKKTHVKNTTTIAPISDGGIRMPDFALKVKACKVMWVKRILSNCRLHHFIEIFGLQMSLENILELNFDVKYLYNYKSSFYKQILEHWFELKNAMLCVKPEIIRAQVICYNVNIQVDGKPILNNAVYRSVKYIQDIVDKEGNFLNLDLINNLHDSNISIMLYNSIKVAIPKCWRKILKSSKPIEISKDVSLYLDGKNTCINNISSKSVYWNFVNAIKQSPSAIAKWEELYPEYNFEWKDIYCTPFRVAQETKLRSLHYMIVNRFFPCNYMLNIWYPEQSKLCIYCNVTDTIRHYFFDCIKVDIFWQHFSRWMLNVTGVNLHLGCLDVLLGIHNPNQDPLLDCFNYCMLFAKDYIYNQKRDNKECVFNLFQLELKIRLEAEKYRCSLYNKTEQFEKQWSEIVNDLM